MRKIWLGGMQVLGWKQILSRSESRQDFRQFLSTTETLDEFRYEMRGDARQGGRGSRRAIASPARQEPRPPVEIRKLS